MAGQSLAKTLIHLVFSTKGREPLINDDARTKLHAFIAGVLADIDSPAIRVGGTVDHVHVLFILSKTRALSDVVQEIKQSSSKWMKTYENDFYWQSGYGAFSVGESAIEALSAYIDGQVEHHHKATFEEEFRKLCAQYHVVIKEEYVWD